MTDKFDLERRIEHHFGGSKHYKDRALLLARELSEAIRERIYLEAGNVGDAMDAASYFTRKRSREELYRDALEGICRAGATGDPLFEMAWRALSEGKNCDR